MSFEQWIAQALHRAAVRLIRVRGSIPHKNGGYPGIAVTPFRIAAIRPQRKWISR